MKITACIDRVLCSLYTFDLEDGISTSWTLSRGEYDMAEYGLDGLMLAVYRIHGCKVLKRMNMDMNTHLLKCRTLT